MTRCASPTCATPNAVAFWEVAPLTKHKDARPIWLCSACLALWCDSKGAKPRESTEAKPK
jgi:hypothetical protein